MFESEFHECNNRKCTPSCLHTKNSSLKVGKGNNVQFDFFFMSFVSFSYKIQETSVYNDWNTSLNSYLTSAMLLFSLTG